MSLRLGVIGLSASGGWAATAHVPATRAVEGVEITALVASSAESARRAAEVHGVARACVDVDELLARDDVDLVVVSVKVPDHRELVLRAVAAGKDVYCEWPLGTDLAEGEELARAAEAAGVRTFIGLQARSSPVATWMRRLIADGFVGEVLSTNVSGTGLLGDMTLPERSRYQLEPANGAGVLTIPFAHALDLVAAVLGPVQSVSAELVAAPTTVALEGTSDVVPRAVANQVVVAAVLEGGAVAALHYRGGRSAGDEFRWEVNGSAGQLVVTGTSGNPQMARLDVMGARRGDERLSSLHVPAELFVDHVPTPAHAASLADAWVAIRDDLRDGTSHAPGFADAVRLHAVLRAVETAAAEGRRVVVGAAARAQP